jgi:predicted aldo/keto reductase-like oxidoreductase
VDFYHFWGINQKVFDEKIVPLGLIEKAKELQQKGKIRHISFSFHDSPEALKHIIDHGEGLESVLLQYNLLDRANEEMISYAASKGLGVVVMGPVGGGRLAYPTELSERLGSGKLNTYELALRFVLGNKDVCCALSGMQNATMVQQNAAVASLEEPMSQEQWRQVGDSLENLKKFSELYCTGCAYCQPCPKGINIPKIFQAYTYHNVYGLHELAKKTFDGYVHNEKQPGATSAACVGCGYCEKKCPQHLKVRDLLKMAEEKLSAL